MTNFPQVFEDLLITPWNQESQVIPTANAIVAINDMLCDSAVMVQGYRTLASAIAMTTTTGDPNSPVQAFSMDVALPIVDDETWHDGTR